MLPWRRYVWPEPPAETQYRITGLLHQGQFACVSQAVDMQSGETVVLKQFQTGTGAAYRRELSAALALRHPHIVRCLGTFQSPGSAGCIVYEFIDGCTLAQHLLERSCLPAAQVRRCLRELAHTLAYIHAQGRIHCDLKPDNILLATDDADFRLVLADLGAVCSEAEARHDRHNAATPAYLAPERVYGGFFANSDLYSLGVLGFELATGQRPFQGGPKDVLRAHLSRPPPLQHVADAELREILEHLLEKEPRRRIQSADILLAMLDLPAASLPPPSTRRMSAPPLRQLHVASANKSQAYFQRHSTATAKGKLAALVSAGVDAAPCLLMDYDTHAELLAMETRQPVRVFGKIGNMPVQSSQSFSYASAHRVFRFDMATETAACVYEHCQGLIHHVLAAERLLWQSRFALHYVDLASGCDHTFRSGCYFSPSHAVVFADGSFCHSGGIANQMLMFRNAAATLLSSHALDGPVLALSQDGGQWLAVASDLAQPGRLQIACGHLAQGPVRTAHLPPNLVDWCCVAGRVFWLAAGAGIYGLDADLAPQRLADTLPSTASALQVSPDCRWLALQTAQGIAVWPLQPAVHPACASARGQ